MIKADIFRNKNKDIYGFRITGHAGYSEEGSDIICSAVTILVINTINSIELFTKDDFNGNMDEENGGFIEFFIPAIEAGNECHDAQLLLKTMLNGLNTIRDEYSCYIQVNDEEV